MRSAMMAGLAVLAGASAARAELVYGLTTSNQLVTFDSATPNLTSVPLAISGLVAGEVLQDIDIRPSNQLIYTVGRSGTIYTVNPVSGLATALAALAADPTDLTNPYSGLDPAATRFGIDFNPVPDRLRVVSNTGQNLRINVDTSRVITDGNLNGAASRAVSVAYTNNDTNPATGTTLFYIDSGSPGTTYTTADPNNGVLTVVTGPGSLAQNTNDLVGFDISGSGAAFASLTNPATGFSSFYTFSTGTGAAAFVGAIGSAAAPLTLAGIATIPLPAPGFGVLAAMGGLAALRRRR